MNRLLNISSTLLSGISSIFAVAAGLYALHNWMMARSYKKRLLIFSNASEIKEDLLKLDGRTVNFSTLLDFSVWNEFTHLIATTTEYEELLHRPASEINNKPLPLYAISEDGHLDSFARLVISLNNSERLKFSYGGTGVVYVLLRGKFEIEVRHYADHFIEFTLREVS